MDPIFVIVRFDDDGASYMVTYRLTQQEADAFVKIYNLNRHSGLAEVHQVLFI